MRIERKLGPRDLGPRDRFVTAYEQAPIISYKRWYLKE